MSQFDTNFLPLKTKKDRYESLYIFVVHGITADQFNDKVCKMIGIVDKISNPSKKSYIKHRLHLMTSHIEGMNKDEMLNDIFFLSEDVKNFELTKQWKETLIHFQCDNFNVKYGNTFDLDWLRSFLLDMSYVDVIHVKNNDVKHYQLNSTKKRLHDEQTTKNLDLQNYIVSNIGEKQLCIVHGVSGLLKILSDSSNGYLKVYKFDRKDEDILDDIEKINNGINASQLEIWMGKFLDPKDGKKIVFGKDVSENIKNKMLETVFCSQDMATKIKEKVSSEYLVFNMIIVKTFGDDVGKRLINDFNGIIGIKFY